eukprot:TRINITY_DN6756_c0_g2_i1.p1 TRINITY_DN6756_c0_g2~~TRINITY_DN6756_c0_g2_i1.p1  ORF type:complete len:197 (-),score=32.81 TRINITY_DN6756_c0_g2_i1:16-606(-)
MFPLVGTPSFHQLSELKKACLTLDADQNGWLSWNQFNAVGLWFQNEKGPDEVQALRSAMFLLFAQRVQGMDEPVVLYLQLILYFCLDDQHHLGLEKAFRLASESESECESGLRPLELALVLYRSSRSLLPLVNLRRVLVELGVLSEQEYYLPIDQLEKLEVRIFYSDFARTSVGQSALAHSTLYRRKNIARILTTH